MEQKASFKRTQLKIISQFQRWFVLNLIGYTAAFLIVFAVGLFVWFRLIVNELLDVAGLLSPTFVESIHRHMTLGIIASCIFFVAVIGVVVIHTVIFSRRLAGPIFALSRHLEKCANQGKLEPFYMREGDLFGEMAEHITALAKQGNPQ